MFASPRSLAAIALVATTAACPLPSADSAEFACRAAGDCAADWTCVDGSCRRRCGNDVTCAPGQACREGGCVPAETGPGSSSGTVASSISVTAGSSRRASSARASSGAAGSSSTTTAASRGDVFRANLVYVGGGGGTGTGAQHSIQLVVPAGPAFTPTAPTRMCVGPLTTIQSR